MSEATTYTVVYRTGGTENCVWKRCLAVVTYREALGQSFDLERAGYKAIIYTTRMLEIIGLPEGWDGE